MDGRWKIKGEMKYKKMGTGLQTCKRGKTDYSQCMSDAIINFLVDIQIIIRFFCHSLKKTASQSVKFPKFAENLKFGEFCLFLQDNI
jgi:hypothetical protein